MKNYFATPFNSLIAGIFAGLGFLLMRSLELQEFAQHLAISCVTSVTIYLFYMLVLRDEYYQFYLGVRTKGLIFMRVNRLVYWAFGATAVLFVSGMI